MRPLENVRLHHAGDRAAPGRIRRSTSQLVQSEISILGLVTTSYAGAALLGRALFSWPIDLGPAIQGFLGGAVLGSFVAIVLIGAGGTALGLIRITRGDRHEGGLATRLQRLVTWKPWLRMILLIAVLGLFMAIFVGWKRAIPSIVPFQWDPTFAEIDRVLHFGRHPWEWIHPLVGHPKLTKIIDTAYYLWFPIGIAYVALTTLDPDRNRRRRVLLAYCLCWIVLGTILATLFSSAGPCYYTAVVQGEENPFQGLMAYLHGVDELHQLTALQVQSILWTGYTTGTTQVLIEGISAMPSLHMALPALFGIASWSRSRSLGIGFALYTGIILVGSVHLGWHYAIDGYVSLLVVPLLWWISGRWTGS